MHRAFSLFHGGVDRDPGRTEELARTARAAPRVRPLQARNEYDKTIQETEVLMFWTRFLHVFAMFDTLLTGCVFYLCCRTSSNNLPTA